MKRREFIAFLGTIAVAPPREAIAQTSRIYRLGTLTVSAPISPTVGPGAVLVAGLAQRGYALGQNLAYEARGAAGKVDQTPQLMQELKAANVDVVVTVSYPAAVAAKASGVPTVIASGSGDPVATRLVESLRRPGSNVTGISDDASMLSTKRLALLKEMSPQLRRVAML
jgi:putative ABC transport system substrate-binding protein